MSNIKTTIARLAAVFIFLSSFISKGAMATGGKQHYINGALKRASIYNSITINHQSKLNSYYADHAKNKKKMASIKNYLNKKNVTPEALDMMLGIFPKSKSLQVPTDPTSFAFRQGLLESKSEQEQTQCLKKMQSILDEIEDLINNDPDKQENSYSMQKDKLEIIINTLCGGAFTVDANGCSIWKTDPKMNGIKESIKKVLDQLDADIKKNSYEKSQSLLQLLYDTLSVAYKMNMDNNGASADIIKKIEDKYDQKIPINANADEKKELLYYLKRKVDDSPLPSGGVEDIGHSIDDCQFTDCMENTILRFLVTILYDGQLNFKTPELQTKFEKSNFCIFMENNIKCKEDFSNATIRQKFLGLFSGDNKLGGVIYRTNEKYEVDATMENFYLIVKDLLRDPNSSENSKDDNGNIDVNKNYIHDLLESCGYDEPTVEENANKEVEIKYDQYTISLDKCKHAKMEVTEKKESDETKKIKEQINKLKKELNMDGIIHFNSSGKLTCMENALRKENRTQDENLLINAWVASIISKGDEGAINSMLGKISQLIIKATKKDNSSPVYLNDIEIFPGCGSITGFDYNVTLQIASKMLKSFGLLLPHINDTIIRKNIFTSLKDTYSVINNANRLYYANNSDYFSFLIRILKQQTDVDRKKLENEINDMILYEIKKIQNNTYKYTEKNRHDFEKKILKLTVKYVLKNIIKDQDKESIVDKIYHSSNEDRYKLRPEDLVARYIILEDFRNQALLLSHTAHVIKYYSDKKPLIFNEPVKTKSDIHASSAASILSCISTPVLLENIEKLINIIKNISQDYQDTIDYKVLPGDQIKEIISQYETELTKQKNDTTDNQIKS